jgi:hypothetical protein
MTQEVEADEVQLEEEAAGEVQFVDEADSTEGGIGDISQAVLWASDWTAETVLSQLERGNIELNPRFQRRDAWSRGHKSRFIESLILGLPIPQIVLAERKGARGQYIVLDGKQRLLSLLHFSGGGEGSDVGFKLSGLEVRTDLKGVSYERLRADPNLQNDFNALSSHVIRAVVLRNWPTNEFLHLVFLRLNTGSVKLSPQELRQAIVPGPYSDFIDDFTIESQPIHRLLGRKTFDPRMRDVELLARALAFNMNLDAYQGRMKDFLDASAISFTENWETRRAEISEKTEQFVALIETLEEIFGSEGIARRKNSRLFNRSIFDALTFYGMDEAVRQNMSENPGAIRGAYESLIADPRFDAAVESDTAGVPNTAARIRLWGKRLAETLELPLKVPVVQENAIRLEDA